VGFAAFYKHFSLACQPGQAGFGLFCSQAVSRPAHQRVTQTVEIVEKRDLDCANYTQTQDLNALLGNHLFRPPDHHLATSSPMPDS
jgi:hypothetical protein